GTFLIGMGEKVDPSKAKAMPAGSFIALAPGTPHFVAVDEETVAQLNNIGPWGDHLHRPERRPAPKAEVTLRGRTARRRRAVCRDNYIQHNLGVADGKDGFIAYFEEAARSHPR